jgi:hypothetical protein
VRAMVTTGAKPLPVDVRYPNLELRWAPDTRIAPPPQAHPPRPRRWLSAAVGVVVLIGLFVAGALFLGRHRRGADRGRPREPSPATNAPAVPPQAAVAFPCPGCQRTLKVKAELAGKKVKCPRCAAAVEVPSAQVGAPGATDRTTA